MSSPDWQKGLTLEYKTLVQEQTRLRDILDRAWFETANSKKA